MRSLFSRVRDAAVALLERHQRHAQQIIPAFAAVHRRRRLEEALGGGDVARGERRRRELRRERREEPRVFRGFVKRERALVVLARLRQQTHARRGKRRERLLGVREGVPQKRGVGHGRARRGVHQRPLPRPGPQDGGGRRGGARRRRRLGRVHRRLERSPPRLRGVGGGVEVETREVRPRRSRRRRRERPAGRGIGVAAPRDARREQAPERRVLRREPRVVFGEVLPREPRRGLFERRGVRLEVRHRVARRVRVEHQRQSARLVRRVGGGEQSGASPLDPKRVDWRV